jgi:hypothetical protein
MEGNEESMSSCPLCSGSELVPVKNSLRPTVFYRHCGECDLISMDPGFHLSAESEKARYQLHQNSSNDEGYVAFLNPVVEEIAHRFKDRMGDLPVQGLDFGSGPAPVLAEILAAKGFTMTCYDPFFSSQIDLQSRTFDFVVSTEVLEHMYAPKRELEKIKSLMSQDATFFVQTQLHQGTEFFKNWWYAKDPTHVCFYSLKSFIWMQRSLGFRNMVIASDGTLIRLDKSYEVS